MEEEIIQQVIPNATADAKEIAERRRAKQIINKALRSGVTMLENRDQTRAMLPGLHYAAMNLLIATLEPALAIDVLSDRMRGIVGGSDNAEAPPIHLEAHEKPAYLEAVVEAGKTITEALMVGFDALEEEGLDNRFPETVLDAALGVLLSAWGADHVRRAILEQSSLLILGVIETNSFMEPSKLLRPTVDAKKDKTEQSPVEKAQVPAKPTQQVCEPPFPHRQRPAVRRASAFLLSDMAHNGANAWVLSYRSYGDDREDERLVSGHVVDHSGRAGWIRALHECVLIICSEAEKVTARIDMSSEMLIRAIEAAPGSRLEIDGNIWADFDTACAIHDLEFRHVSASLQKSEVDKCDFKVREILQERI